MTPTAQSVLDRFERRWEELLSAAPATTADPHIRLALRCAYVGSAITLIAAGVTLLSKADAQRLGDIWAEETLEIMRRFILERHKPKGPVQ